MRKNKLKETEALASHKKHKNRRRHRLSRCNLCVLTLEAALKRQGRSSEQGRDMITAASLGNIYGEKKSRVDRERKKGQ